MTSAGADADSAYFSEETATFGDRLAAARRAAGLKQESLSRNLGIKLKTLLSWEDNVSEPRANKLQMIAGVLNVSIIWLLTGEGEGVKDPWREDVEAPAATPDLAEAVAEIRAVRAANRALGERLLKLERLLADSRRA